VSGNLSIVIQARFAAVVAAQHDEIAANTICCVHLLQQSFGFCPWQSTIARDDEILPHPSQANESQGVESRIGFDPQTLVNLFQRPAPSPGMAVRTRFSFTSKTPPRLVSGAAQRSSSKDALVVKLRSPPAADKGPSVSSLS